MKTILVDALNKGCQVIYDYNKVSDFENKGRIIGELISKNVNKYNISIPLDCDEFIVLESPHGRYISKDKLQEYFATIKDGAHCVFNRYLNTAEKDFLLRILYHFLFLYFVPVTVAGIFFYIYSLFIYLSLKKYLLLNLFFLAPFIYVVFISSFPKMFMNRNINFLIPIIIISTYVGYEFFRYSISIKKLFAVFYFLIFISIFLYVIF